jgi:hypothetical protein
MIERKGGIWAAIEVRVGVFVFPGAERETYNYSARKSEAAECQIHS